MGDFGTFIGWGFDHILEGVDHVLFILVLCAFYKIEEWKRVLVLVTAFTVGHSVTLALAANDLLVIPSGITESLIAYTILATAIYNIAVKRDRAVDKGVKTSYIIALVFGLIHGMGLSYQFQIFKSGNASIVPQLLGFNVGIELGQLIVVAGFFIILFVISNFTAIKHRDWKIFLSGIASGLAVEMIVMRFSDFMDAL